jgi:hypothetical protein
LRNEISRIKRLSLINAQPVEQLRKASQDRAAAVAARRAVEGASASASAGTPRGSFSSDMLKSTADLLRLKAKARKAGGGTAGSVSGSVASFSASLFSGMGGGATMWGSHTASVRGSVDDDDWELSSQASRVSRDTSGSVSGGASALPVPAYFGGRDVR